MSGLVGTPDLVKASTYLLWSRPYAVGFVIESLCDLTDMFCR